MTKQITYVVGNDIFSLRIPLVGFLDEDDALEFLASLSIVQDDEGNYSHVLIDGKPHPLAELIEIGSGESDPSDIPGYDYLATIIFDSLFVGSYNWEEGSIVSLSLVTVPVGKPLVGYDRISY